MTTANWNLQFTKQISSLAFLLCHWTGYAPSYFGVPPSLNCLLKGNMHCLAILNSVKQFLLSWETSVTSLYLKLWCCPVSTIFWHSWEVCYFTHYPEEHCTRVVNSVFMSIYAQEEHCTWAVSFVIGKLRPGCWLNPDLQIFADLMMFITVNMIYIILWFVCSIT
jgi:hypothetical protein